MMNDNATSDNRETYIKSTMNQGDIRSGNIVPGNMNPVNVDPRKRRLFRIAALLSFVFSYLYVRFLLTSDWGKESFGVRALILTVLMVVLSEWFADADGRSYRKMKEKEQSESVLESYLIAAAAMVEAVGFMVGGPFAEDEFFSAHVFMWHMTIIYFVLARTGMLAAGRTGILFPLDMIEGIFYLPFSNFLLRAKSLYARSPRGESAKTDEGGMHPAVTPEEIREDRAQGADAPDAGGLSAGARNAVIAVVTVLAAVIVVVIAVTELSGVSDAFAGLGNTISDFFRRIMNYRNFGEWFSMTFLPAFFLSIPVGAWLFGLVGGSLSRKAAPLTYQDVSRGLRGAHVFPKISAFIIVGSLLAVYAVFFISSAGELAGMMDLSALSAPQASDLAVRGFWQLVRVAVLNFCVLALFTVFSDVPLWERRSTRIMTALMMTAALLFALLAAWKLFVLYIGMFGPTPRRILSGWTVTVLIVWCVLVIVRLWRKIPAARIGIYYALLSFAAICLINYPALCQNG